MKAIIVEDNPGALVELKSFLNKDHPGIEICGDSGSVIEAAKLIRKEQPELLFLDIELDDGSAFDLLELIDFEDFSIIFTTAKEEYALRAFQFAAIDYLLKPIDPDKLSEAIERARKLRAGKDQISMARNALGRDKSQPERIALHTQERIDIVKLKDIIRCEADGNYSYFHLSNGKKLLVTRTLKDFDRLLSDFGFLRVHQSHLVNIESVEAFNKTDGGYLVLNNREKIPVSTRRRSYVVDALEFMRGF